MIKKLNLKLEWKLPITREELFILVSSWGRDETFTTHHDNITIKECDANKCYNLSNLLHTSKHSFGISFLDSKNSYNKQLLYFTKLALICKQIIFNFYFYLVSQITDFSFIFKESYYNGNLSKWDVSSCKDMNRMFSFSEFNNDSISNWDVSKVNNMIHMFSYSHFNQNINNWNIYNCINMKYMFKSSDFNKDISYWKFNPNISCYQMFADNESFKNKYNYGKEIPLLSDEILDWFEDNRFKISNINILKEEDLNMENYLDNFNISKNNLVR